MMNDSTHHRLILQRIAHRAMIERGLEPDFSREVLAELDGIAAAATDGRLPRHDLRDMLWASIDNDDSRDLDQLTVAVPLAGGAVKLLVAIADVDALVEKGSAIDRHAGQNTTSVYTPCQIFPMLPEKLSTDLTSLSEHGDRCAIVIEMEISSDGTLSGSDVYAGLVRNRAKLTYNGVGAWLAGDGPMPDRVAALDGLAENLRLQNSVAQKLRRLRFEHGALDLQTIETRPVFDAGEIRDLRASEKNRATELIEDFMVAANGVTARYLTAHRFPSLRRIVRTPKRWDRIVDLAAQRGSRLPADPDSHALQEFLALQKAADRVRFPDLSLSVVKLMGPGEYAVEEPGEGSIGHFGLAVRDYNHSTAPNRRYPDLVTQRLLKASLAGQEVPYEIAELQQLAKHCTEQADDAAKVERQVEKSAAAILLEHRLGDRFDAIVTGASPKGTWVRILQPPVEGMLAEGFEGADVGERLRVKLVRTDVDRGFIDFVRA
ncbi:MAG: RNB domain-containing ribonuclease [Acidobacteriota bacterium]